MSDLNILLWAWKRPAKNGHKGNIKYGPELLNMQAKVIRKNLRIPHSLTAITDYEPHEFDSEIRVVSAEEHFGELAHLGGCYRRLKMFSPEARELLGPRVVSIDLDMVVVGDLTPLFETWHSFRIWKSESLSGQPYNGSLMALTTGAHPQPWTEFTLEHSVPAARLAGFRGTDQSIIALTLGKDMPVWTMHDGVMYLGRHCGVRPPPEFARVVFSPGGAKVTDPLVQRRFPWIRDYLVDDYQPLGLTAWDSAWVPKVAGDEPKPWRPRWRRMQEMRQAERDRMAKEQRAMASEASGAKQAV